MRKSRRRVNRQSVPTLPVLEHDESDWPWSLERILDEQMSNRRLVPILVQRHAQRAKRVEEPENMDN